MKCNACGKTYTPDCDWQQGRCPHHPPLLQMNIQPQDPSRGHFYVSLVKSATRMAAGIALIWPQSLILAGAFLIAAEILGVIEELV